MKIKKLHRNAVTPSYAHETDACFDLTAATVAGMTELGRHVDPCTQSCAAQGWPLRSRQALPC